jgi:hypothetical protein
VVRYVVDVTSEVGTGRQVENDDGTEVVGRMGVCVEEAVVTVGIRRDDVLEAVVTVGLGIEKVL